MVGISHIYLDLRLFWKDIDVDNGSNTKTTKHNITIKNNIQKMKSENI